MGLAVELGLSISEWEDMTPNLFRIWGEARRKAIENRQEAEQANMYALACMIRTAVWGKRMPEYERIFRKAQTRQMTDEEMFERVQVLNRLLGGTEEQEDTGAWQ